MPLVKKPSGWFWGSKGPFDSKAKALAVARAAYAHGYKGESDVSMQSHSVNTLQAHVRISQENVHKPT